MIAKRNKKVWILVLSGSVAILVYLVVNLTYVVEERFNVKQVETFILKVKDNGACIHLVKGDCVDLDTSQILLLGIRLMVDYVSLEHENLYLEDTKIPPGSRGIIDSLNSVKLLTKSEQREVSNQLQNATAFKNFLVDSLSLPNHSGTKECFTAITTSTLDDMIKDVNERSTGRMTDLRLFKVSPQLVQLLRSDELQLKMEFKSGREIVGIWSCMQKQ